MNQAGTLPDALLGAARRVLKSIVFRNFVPCFWSASSNWGDALSPHLVRLISGKPARFEANPYCWKFFTVGSIFNYVDGYSTVWGTGMIAPDSLPRQAPNAIHAVRGPLTRERLMLSGIRCPRVYGDPALLLANFFHPAREVQWQLGVVSHYTDKGHPWVAEAHKQDKVRVIDVCSGLEEFVHQVCSCERILSSSLHGLICADAYGIPNRRIILAGGLTGGDFKFLDYYGAFDLAPEQPIRPKPGESAIDLVPGITRCSGKLDLGALLESCPFKAQGKVESHERSPA